MPEYEVLYQYALKTKPYDTHYSEMIVEANNIGEAMAKFYSSWYKDRNTHSKTTNPIIDTIYESDHYNPAWRNDEDQVPIGGMQIDEFFNDLLHKNVDGTICFKSVDEEFSDIIYVTIKELCELMQNAPYGTEIRFTFDEFAEHANENVMHNDGWYGVGCVNVFDSTNIVFGHYGDGIDYVAYEVSRSPLQSIIDEFCAYAKDYSDVDCDENTMVCVCKYDIENLKNGIVGKE